MHLAPSLRTSSHEEVMLLKGLLSKVFCKKMQHPHEYPFPVVFSLVLWYFCPVQAPFHSPIFPFTVVSWHGRSLLIRIKEPAWFDDLHPIIGMPRQFYSTMHVSLRNNLWQTGQWYHTCSNSIHNVQRERAYWALDYWLYCCKNLSKIFNIGKEIHTLCDLQKYG
jgi:hypothetical protein